MPRRIKGGETLSKKIFSFVKKNIFLHNFCSKKLQKILRKQFASSILKKVTSFAFQEFLTPPRILFWSFAWTAVISRMPKRTAARTYRPCLSFAPTFPAHSCRPGLIPRGVFAMKLQASKKG